MVKRGLWILFIVLSILVGLYPGIYFIIERDFGLLSSKSTELLNDIFWNVGFYAHIILGGLALMIGWIQFCSKWRKANVSIHRKIGGVYLCSALISSLAGFYIAFFATGGMISSIGFLLLAIIWFYTSMMAYIAIRKGQIRKHREWMVYSFSACFAAATLRIWMPILIAITGEFIMAYRIVAWLCWIPNLIFAWRLNRKWDSQ